MGVPERAVLDAEPLVAHADGEPGSDTVEAYLDAVSTGDTAGFVSRVNLTAVRHILARKYDRTVADEYIDWLLDLGVEGVDVGAVWAAAADFVIEHRPALGDAFALATAEREQGTLLVGADADYEAIEEPPVVRFRQDSA